MTLFQGSGADPRARAAQLADVLAWYGAVGDAALGNAVGFGARKASIAVALAQLAGIPENEQRALHLAGILHAVGAIGSNAYRKGESLSPRIKKMESWDVPARGARFAQSVAGIPIETADMVRWQSECWDGTGYPDQIRWHGIPPCSQYLALADFFLRANDPEEALGEIGLAAGRSFGPDNVRLFTMWFHMNPDEISPLPFPLDTIDGNLANPEAVLEGMADAIDAHNDVAGRWRRVASLAQGAASLLGHDAAQQSALAIGCRIFGAGEVVAEVAEDDQFDPLARLGIEARAKDAVQSAAFASPFENLKEAAVAIGDRAEWFDGTGKPKGKRSDAISPAGAVLATAIAHDLLDRSERLEDAAGTQFDPRVVKAVLDSAKALA